MLDGHLLVDAHVHSDMFRERYADVYHGDDRWRVIREGAIPASEISTFFAQG